MDRLSSELLGFAPDVRVLIVNCDDFGMHDAVNAAVVESIENGIASSCSLMVPCPAAADAMRLLRERPHIPFGIHLALIRDSPEYRWGPAAAKPDRPDRRPRSRGPTRGLELVQWVVQEQVPCGLVHLKAHAVSVGPPSGAAGSFKGPPR